MNDIASLVIEQARDASDKPSFARYRRVIEPTLSFPRSSVAIDVLVRLDARRRPGELGLFDYVDSGRGSGTVRAEGFNHDEVRVIDDHFRIEEMRLRLGLPSSVRSPLAIRLMWTRPGATRNPIPMLVLGAMFVAFGVTMGVLSSVGPLRVPGETMTWAYLPLFAALAAGGVVIVIQHARRLRPWFALRAAFRSEGEQLPVGLRWGD